MSNISRASRNKGLLAESALDEEAFEAPTKVASRAESSLDRARRRAAELRGHMGEIEDGLDEFHIPPDMIPDGWTYEWKRHTVFNQEDPAYNVQLAREGWEPVPVNRCPIHRSMMPVNWAKHTIERKGMVLMERPAEITADYRNRDIRRAKFQVMQKEQQLSSTPDGTLTRDDPRVSPKIKKSYEPIAIPEE